MHDKKNAVEKREELPAACQIKVNAAAPAVVGNTPAALSATTNTANNSDTIVCVAKPVKEPLTGPPTNYCSRRSWVTTERMNELRRHAQDAVKQNKTFTIRGCFSSVRNALLARGWVEKLDLHRKQVPSGICQVTFEDLALGLPKRKPGETRRQYVAKCERNITSRFLEHMPIDFLWTNRKEKCDFIDQAKNPGMTINKFHRAPFTSKEGLCSQLKDFHWYYEENTAELYFPRCFNVWSPEELNDFVENFKLTACISFVRLLVNNYKEGGFDAMFSPNGKVPFTAIDFAYKRCTDYIDSCQHNDIDVEDLPRIWDHDWDAFLHQQHVMANEGSKILADPHKIVEHIIKTGAQLLEAVQQLWPQYALDGYQNLWIVKPANKCRGRGIQLMDNLKRIMSVVNPSIASKSRFVVQKYIERPLIIHNTKFDIRQWFLITNVQPLVVWMYKESYLRFSSQEYSLSNHHESVHLTNHAIQKKYTNAKRDKRLPIENMWDCYSFQAYLRQIGKSKMWLERIYPGMRKAIVGTMLASQENMDRRPNTFELFGADFMITDDFNPWLIEINSSPDLGATTSVTARMCPQCLEDVIKVVIDRRNDPKADLGNFELIYRQVVPPTPAYMGLNLFIKGKQLMPKQNQQQGYQQQRRERTLHTSNLFRQRTALIPAVSNVHRVMPIFNATDYIERCMGDAQQSSRSSGSGATVSSILQQATPIMPTGSARTKLTTTHCPNLLKIPLANICILRRSLTTLPKASTIPTRNEPESNVLSSSNKRHRSCGPRLASAVHDLDNEQHLRCISKKCALQNTLVPTKVKDTSPEKPRPKKPCNEHENVKKCKKLLALLNHDSTLEKTSRHASRIAQTQRTVGAQEQLLNAAVRSQSSLNLSQARKSAQRRCSTSARKRSVTNITAEMYATCKPRAEASSSVMHAIGKGLSPWKAARRQTARHKTFTGQSPNKVASVSDAVVESQAKADNVIDAVDQSQSKTASVDTAPATCNNADLKSTINLSISQKSSSNKRSARVPLARNTRC